MTNETNTLNETKEWNYTATKVTTGEVSLRVTPQMNREDFNKMLHRWNCQDVGFWQYAAASEVCEQSAPEATWGLIVAAAKQATLTANEVTLLKSFAESEYHDGRHPVGDFQWFDNPFTSKKTCGGVMASLSKKGFAKDTDSGTRDHAACITAEGWAALQIAEPAFCTQFEGRMMDPFREITSPAEPVADVVEVVPVPPTVQTVLNDLEEIVEKFKFKPTPKKPDVMLLMSASDYTLLKARLTTASRQWLATKEVR
jgi:hypothetical protein